MIARALFVGGAVLLLAGCAYKPLRAPCSPDDGVPPGLGTVIAPLPYAEARTALPEPFRSRTLALGPTGHDDTCGPMRPI